MFSHDRAIIQTGDDSLSRKEFSEKLAGAIKNIKGDESIVLSINGAWGSGKTSVINLIKENIRDKYPNKIKLIDFNPWFYTDRSNLILKFFESLCAQVGLFEDDKKKKKLFEKISYYAANFEVVASYIPYASSGVKAIKDASKQIGKKYKDKLTNIENQREELRELFKELEYKFLVIIDDFDRLSASEIRDIFQLVKLVADIPNIIYLLSFDRGVVSKALDKLQDSKGKEYLEKIVQVPFELPLASKEDIETLFFKNIYDLLEEIPKEEFETDRWLEMYREGLRFQLKTIRYINRFVNILKFDFALLKNEVNIVDLIGITAIKVFHPELYEIIKSNKEMFLNIPGDSLFSASKLFGKKKNDTYKDQLNDLLEGLNLDFSVKRILLSLFPQTYEAIGDGFYSSISMNEDNDRRKQRICSRECFDIYFLFRVPKEIITNNDMKRVLDIQEENEFKYELSTLRDKGKIISYLERLEDFTDEIKEKDFSKIINSLYDLGDTFEDRSEVHWLYPSEIRISRITSQLLKRIPDKNKRYTLLGNAIKNAETSIYIPTREITKYDQMHGRFRWKDKRVKEEDLMLNDNDLDRLENLGKKKIDEWMNNGRLINSEYLLAILHWWEDGGGSNNIKKFIKENYKSNKSLIELLKKFLSRVSVQSSAGYETKYYNKMDYKSVKHFLDIKFIYKKLKELSSKYIDKLDDLGKDAVRLFIDHYEGKIEEDRRI
ncbi:MAG: hypothetical protein ISS16_09715 [Ignavibacteria bacterium]|nr:hypothetical protein [Ignavibacteria bacterium]